MRKNGALEVSDKWAPCVLGVYVAALKHGKLCLLILASQAAVIYVASRLALNAAKQPAAAHRGSQAKIARAGAFREQHQARGWQ